MLTIGALAKASGVTAPTIRFYEEIRLTPKARRSASGQRCYEKSDLERLTFIKQCRDFGFGIEQVRLLLDLSISRDRNCFETRDIAQAHLQEVRLKMEALRVLEARLATFVKHCSDACAGGPGPDCVIFKDLGDTQPRIFCGCP